MEQYAHRYNGSERRNAEQFEVVPSWDDLICHNNTQEKPSLSPITWSSTFCYYYVRNTIFYFFALQERNAFLDLSFHYLPFLETHFSAYRSRPGVDKKSSPGSKGRRFLAGRRITPQPRHPRPLGQETRGERPGMQL